MEENNEKKTLEEEVVEVNEETVEVIDAEKERDFESWLLLLNAHRRKNLLF